MKKFIRFIGELKSWGCLSFTGALCIYMFIDWLYGGEYIRYSLIIQLLAMCGVITIFGVCEFFAWAFHWFPMDNLGAWVSFIVIFFVAFIVLCLGFEVYFRVLGKKYDQALGRHRKRPEDGR